MLKGIPKIISPELLKVLCEMGHSDRIVIADGNFPAESMGKDAKVIRMDGHGIPEILDAILLGWKVSRSPSFSPVPTNLIGLPVTARTESAAPPLVSESSLVKSTLSMCKASSKLFATFTAS